ncbi:hypothetical protein PPL_09459 [Heterostelium album PN500]|uniref:Uncharacterized protein n=1 Tax=Heterostelium pallidum (strain ATCC 26659 / Pp 5 / PN500) TaxID=670386 RepID=D3BPJ0_HETP5|nr:hypothetical protein PPL_09459 [Heterostelium album PN500]EFA76708.1 hypothetical protein PPL_09459 [Heterostelium album PN500]|eukprot:XP_020428840.1 hypothetical protein PPL_09459 [Heterostelium album PN500]
MDRNEKSSKFISSVQAVPSIGDCTQYSDQCQQYNTGQSSESIQVVRSPVQNCSLVMEKTQRQIALLLPPLRPTTSMRMIAATTTTNQQQPMPQKKKSSKKSSSSSSSSKTVASPRTNNNSSNNSNTVVSTATTVSSTSTSTSATTQQVVLSYGIEDLLVRATDLVNADKIDEAIADLTDVIKMDGNETRALGLRADLYEHKGRFQEALADYKRVLELIPESIPCLSSMAECYIGLKDFDRAIKVFEQVLTIEPRYAPVLGLISEMYIKLGNLNKALDYCKRLLEIEPENINGYLMLGHVAFKQQSFDHAIKLYKRAIDIGRSVDRDTLLQVHSINTDGPKLKKSNDYNPIYGAAVCLASIAEIQGDVAAQMKWVDFAIEEHPQSAYAIGLKGTYLLRQKQPEQALVLLKSAMDIDPESEIVKMALADCLFDLERTDESIHYYTLVLANMLERDLPEEANTRVMLLHNLLIGYVKQVNSFPDLEVDCDIEIEDVVTSELNDKPQNLQELSKKARALVLVLNRILEKQAESSQLHSFVKSSINTLKHIALSSNQSLEIRHNQKVTLDRESILDPLDEILFYYYDFIKGTYFGQDN